MTTPDVATLQQHIDIIVRAATRLRQHAADLHSLGWDPHHGDTTKVRETKTDYVPRVADEAPRARRVFERLAAELASIQGEITGLDRAMMQIFTARAERPDPTRGSTISVAEFDRLRTKQRDRRARGEYVPAQIEMQPQHPGRRK